MKSSQKADEFRKSFSEQDKLSWELRVGKDFDKRIDGKGFETPEV